MKKIQIVDPHVMPGQMIGEFEILENGDQRLKPDVRLEFHQEDRLAVIPGNNPKYGHTYSSYVQSYWITKDNYEDLNLGFISKNIPFPVHKRFRWATDKNDFIVEVEETSVANNLYKCKVVQVKKGRARLNDIMQLSLNDTRWVYLPNQSKP